MSERPSPGPRLGVSLSVEEVRALSRIEPWRTWVRIASLWGQIAAVLAAACVWPHPLVIVAAFVLLTRHQKALGTLSHDGAHRRLFQSARLNDYVSQLLLAGAVHLFAAGYRRTHLKHHCDPLIADDPDIGITGGYPLPWRSFARKLLRDLSGRTYIKFVRHFIVPHARTRRQATGDPASVPRAANEGVPVWLAVLGMLAWNIIIAAALWAAAHPLYFLLLWLLPQMTLLQVFLRIRGIAEHAGYQPSENQALNTRTVENRWQAWFVAPNHINYHIEHHLYPSVPWYNLRRVHALLEARGALPPGRVYSGYGAVLRELVTP